MIATIKREHIKSIQTSRGSYVGHMEPRFIQNRLPPGGSPSEQTLAPRTVTWICLPYFTLERYSGLLAADNPRLFPMQTLLQAQFSGATRDRDMQQAVRQRKGSSEVCFHIAQLWCLILDNCRSPYAVSNPLIAVLMYRSSPSSHMRSHVRGHAPR